MNMPVLTGLQRRANPPPLGVEQSARVVLWAAVALSAAFSARFDATI
jgi:hypothetical protein